MIPARVSARLCLGIILILSSIFYSVDADTSHPTNNWREILAIGDDKDYTIGAELTVSIEPDHYYLKRGDMVTLSGILRGIFGPLSESQITVERTFNREEAQPLVTWTDSSGRYAVADNLTEPGIYTYQAVYSDTKKPELLKSQKIEISCIDAAQTGDIRGNQIEDSTDATNNSSKVTDNQANIFVDLISEESSFTPGSIVSLNGIVLSQNSPLAYAPVFLQPGGGQNHMWGEAIPFQTTKDGRVNASFHLTGPDPISFSLMYQKGSSRSHSRSEPVVLFPRIAGVPPPARIVHAAATIDAYIDNETVESMQNVTIYGWYCRSDGSAGSFSPLHLVWYNVGGKIWDQYQNSSMILTDASGQFECTVSAPQTPGMYLLSVKKEGNTTTPPIYSNVLPLTVRAPVGMDDNPSYGTGIDQPLGQVHLSTSSPHVKVAEEIQISLLPILPDYLDENMLSEIALSLYYSDNGIDWYLYKKIEPVASLQEITIPFVPDHTGYIYFRAVLAYASEKISEETLVIPVLEDT